MPRICLPTITHKKKTSNKVQLLVNLYRINHQTFASSLKNSVCRCARPQNTFPSGPIQHVSSPNTPPIPNLLPKGITPRRSDEYQRHNAIYHEENDNELMTYMYKQLRIIYMKIYICIHHIYII